MPNYVPTLSSDEVFIGEDITQFLTPKLNTMESRISSLQTGKADTNHAHNDYSPIDHTHTGYAASDHTHTGYAASDHTHTGYAASDHTHTGYAASDHTHTEYAPVSHEHSGYAASDHTHTGYAASDHTHTPASIGAAASDHTHSGYALTNHVHTGYASSNHTHSASDVGAAATNHTHSNYASTTHTHSNYASSTHNHDDDYLAKSGGTVSGNLNVNGIVRVNSKQMIFDSGTMSTFGTNNQPTMIAGSQVYSKTSIVVSSDRRLKTNINNLGVNSLSDFINKLQVVSYNYNDDKEGEKPRIGLIAQDIQNADSELSEYFVFENAEGMLGIKPADLVFPLIAAVQKLSAEVEALKSAK